MIIACYCRVSSDEQARHGISIEAQEAALRAWADREGHSIAKVYTDAGISGKKPPAKRPALSQFFRDLESGLKVDCLCFCRLDRFFRSVKLYYQAMDILDRYHVAWTAIQEDYETVTASGRMKVNIMLSVAENEADRTSERIKAVFEHKVDKGECLNPNGLPLGYKCEGKKVVPDENAPAALALFEHYAAHGNKSQARHHLHDAYGIPLPITSVTNMLHNPLYKGQYRDNPEYCEAIVPPELFDKVQRDLASRSTRKTPSGRVYLFSGLLICRDCGRRLCSAFKPPRYYYYRCPAHSQEHICSNNRAVFESRIERFLVAEVEKEVAGQSFKTEAPKRKKAVNRSAILQKIDRLKDLYVDGFISKDQYKADYEKLTAQLVEPPEPKQSPFIELVGDNFREDYETFTRDEKKFFWRAVVDHIEIDPDGSLFCFFA